MKPYRIFLLLPVLMMVLSACTQQSVVVPLSVENHRCEKLFTRLDTLVKEQSVRDVQDRVVSQFPYLRVNRFLSSFRYEVNGAAFEQWLDELQALGIQGWLLEYARLDEGSQTALWRQAQAAAKPGLSLQQVLHECAERLRDRDLRSEKDRQALREAAIVTDNYSYFKRLLGLYPLSAILIRQAIDDWHDETRKTYALPLQKLPVVGQLHRYSAENDSRLTQSAVEKILRETSRNPLRISHPSIAQQALLFSTYAPLLDIDSVSGDDLPGMPTWTADNGLVIDSATPAVFHYLSHTRFAGQSLLQLNYLIWFPARTASSGLDLLAGRLDGLTWRVTLLPNGEPLVFDSIHNCGCYHLFFNGRGVRQEVPMAVYREPAFFPAMGSYSFMDLPLVIRIASGTHAVQRVSPSAESATRSRVYSLFSADVLRSLPWLGHQRRSLYNEQGLVSGTERLERFLLWPMGIDNPGAMRQAGHHATAFVGRRHFDDAYLFESLLRLGEQE